MHKDINNCEEIITLLESNDIKELSVSKSFELAVYTYGLLETDKHNAEKIVINILNYWNKIPQNTYELWTDIIEVAGFYPYLEKEKNRLKFNNLFAEIRKGRHLSSNLENKFFHEEQLKALNILEEGKNLILSAPTSFGKSLLIEEIVASNKYKNIVVIQPTLALLDETRQKLNKYNKDYKLLIRTTQEPSDVKGNIFLFTAERVNEYQYFSSVDFLVIDEFYKLSGQRDDERSAFLNNAFYHLYRKFNPQFYMLGPNIDGISEGFSEKYNVLFYKTNYSLVDDRVINIYEDYDWKFKSDGERRTTKESKSYKNNILFELLLSLQSEQTIIYCSSPNRVKELSHEFANFLKCKGLLKNNFELFLIEWIQENVSEKWDIIQGLLYGIGTHDGVLVKHIASTIIDYFNEGKLKYLFCTSTIIEGVNTSAKNIIFFDPKKGRSNVDFFDYANIKGRAGRMMEHYVGKIYNFNAPPKKLEEYIVDIPFFQQNPIKDETLIQLDASDVKIRNTAQYKEILNIPESDREVIKNNGISVKGQIRILRIMRRIMRCSHYNFYWTTPKYEQLFFILKLANKYLMIKGETRSPVSIPKLSYLTNKYMYKNNLKGLIDNEFSYARQQLKNKEKTDHELYNEKIQLVFQIIKHWIQYKIPKWLSVIHSLQELVCSEMDLSAGNYLHYASLLENDSLPENLTILLEYGIPVSAIRKIEDSISPDLNQDGVIPFIQDKRLHEEKKLLPYEREKLKKLL